MAALAHLGVGLAAKRINTKIPLYILILSAWAGDIIWTMFFLLGVESYPSSGKAAPSPWSHGLFMNIIWALAAAAITWLISRRKGVSVFIGLLVFSHWAIDLLTHPMRAVMPDDPPLPLFFEGSASAGLGLYSTQLGVNLGEYGSLAVGIIFYALALRKIKRENLRGNS
ncbi:MAG: hypothetical protein HF300_17295 [Ignavibacteria bacterium]|jgi:hypothetical protein|nr:hypothetical protein [Ignavibacteria bacterium]MCU7501135.1 hypothetical protein [Ignavibacteria bacterium]MCU7514317.1 hypothetical protein [Ignavibacteria bacterium]MCU7522256.1 hypothetical protein [Ignavibacteria bacterium]MCU7526616.1 hypothetical protein [Ignavibacteria bacterium]